MGRKILSSEPIKTLSAQAGDTTNSEPDQGLDKKQARVDALMRTEWYRWYALAILVLVYCSSHVDRQIMGILLEPIKLELGASDTQMGFLIGLTFAIFTPPWACQSPCWQTVPIAETSSRWRPRYGRV